MAGEPKDEQYIKRQAFRNFSRIRTKIRIVRKFNPKMGDRMEERLEKYRQKAFMDVEEVE